MMGTRYDTRKRPEIPWCGGTGESPYLELKAHPCKNGQAACLRGAAFFTRISTCRPALASIIAR
jgi:hypothetical protein